MLNFFCTKVEDFYTFDLYNFIFLPKEVDKKSVEIVILLKKLSSFSPLTHFLLFQIYSMLHKLKKVNNQLISFRKYLFSYYELSK